MQGVGLLQTQSQSLNITPQLQQALKVLQCGAFELTEMLDQEINDNPVLQVEDGGLSESFSTDPDSDSSLPELPQPDPMDSMKFESILDYIGSAPIYMSGHDNNSLERIVSSESNMAQQLLSQLGERELNSAERRIAAYIIGNLSEDGYLEASCQEISAELDISPEDFKRGLELVQSFEPAGIAARDLRECLLLQIDRIGKRTSLVGKIVERHLALVKEHQITQIASIEKVELDSVLQALSFLKSLTPFPGRAFLNEKTLFVVPDIFVRKVGAEYVALNNGSLLPKLRVSTIYQELLSNKQSLDRNSRTYLASKMRGASWLMRCLAQREQTVRKVAATIVKYQQKFFNEGADGLRPLVLKDIAGEIHVHESTVSRAMANKYMDTPRGIYEFKYFLIPGVKTKEGYVSTFSIRNYISDFISKEDPNRPVSDRKIAEQLQTLDIAIARRTVTKYRESMGFASALIRKKQSYALPAFFPVP